jgi:ADP-dependent NAD(P)H-hydrate dehydratase
MSLTGLWEHGELLSAHDGRLVITPHAGEMARLMGVSHDVVTAEPQQCAEKASRRLGCLVILKGSSTIVAQPRGASYLHERAVIGLGTSGSGDVLAGILVGLLARGAAPLHAAIWSVYLHAAAGVRLTERIGRLGFLARELPAEIPTIMDALAT